MKQKRGSSSTGTFLAGRQRRCVDDVGQAADQLPSQELQNYGQRNPTMKNIKLQAIKLTWESSEIHFTHIVFCSYTYMEGAP